MQVYINDQPVECREESTVSTLLVQQNILPVNIAVAIEDKVIPKNQWDTTEITKDSHILIIKAVQGG